MNIWVGFICSGDVIFHNRLFSEMICIFRHLLTDFYIYIAKHHFTCPNIKPYVGG